MNKNSNITFSIMKGIAIISVVVGHVFIRTNIERFVNQYHLAVFIFVAGYFFKTNILNPHGFLYKKRIQFLYFPFLIFSSIFLFTHNLLTQCYINNTTLSINDILSDFINIIIRLNSNEALMGAMWFCPMQLIVSIIAITQLKINRKSIMCFSFFILGFILGSIMLYVLHIKSPYCIWQNMILTSIFFVGYFFHQYESGLNSSLTLRIFTLFVSIAIIYISVQLILYARLQPSHITKENPFIILFIGTLGCLMCYSASKIIEIYKISKLFAIIGGHSFSIMTLHFLAFKLISFFIVTTHHYELSKISEFPTIQTNNILWDFSYILSGVTLPVITAILYSKIKNFLIIS